MDRFDKLYSDQGNRIEGSAIRAILSVTQQPGIISLAGGLPSDDAIPVEIIAKLANEAILETPAHALQYSVTEGLLHFRKFLSEWMEKRYGMKYSTDEILITTGSQQAIELTAQMLINPGDSVVIERPTYLAALQIFKKIGATLIEVDCDNEGMIPESLEKILKKNSVKLIYTVPDHQNPAGYELSISRRETLAALSNTYKVPLFEDGAYREIRFSGKPLPPIVKFDDSNHRTILFASTASKILSPGLRVGWVFGPKELINKMALLKQSVDVHTAGLNQEIVYGYLSGGYFETHLPNIIKLYKNKAQLMDTMLKEHGSDVFDWHTPNGGLFIWAKTKKKIDTTKILPDIVKKYKVAYVPGATFFAHNPDKQTLRLNFSKPTEKQIREGIKRLVQGLVNWR